MTMGFTCEHCGGQQERYRTCECYEDRSDTCDWCGKEGRNNCAACCDCTDFPCEHSSDASKRAGEGTTTGSAK